MRTLLTNSVNDYAAFLKTCTATQVTVEDCSTVTNDDKFRRPPLFAVDLAVEGEGPEQTWTYSSPLESFVNVPLERFNDLMTQTQSITRVERVVMRNLFWSFEPVMKSVHPSEPATRLVSSRLAFSKRVQSLLPCRRSSEVFNATV